MNPLGCSFSSNQRPRHAWSTRTAEIPWWLEEMEIGGGTVDTQFRSQRRSSGCGCSDVGQELPCSFGLFTIQSAACRDQGIWHGSQEKQIQPDRGSAPPSLQGPEVCLHLLRWSQGKGDQY